MQGKRVALELLFARTYLEVSKSLSLLLQGIARCLAAFYCQILSNLSARLLCQRKSALMCCLAACVVRITKLSVAGEFLGQGLGKECRK